MSRDKSCKKSRHIQLQPVLSLFLPTHSHSSFLVVKTKGKQTALKGKKEENPRTNKNKTTAHTYHILLSGLCSVIFTLFIFILCHFVQRFCHAHHALLCISESEKKQQKIFLSRFSTPFILCKIPVVLTVFNLFTFVLIVWPHPWVCREWQKEREKEQKIKVRTGAFVLCFDCNVQVMRVEWWNVVMSHWCTVHTHNTLQ